MFGRWFKSKSEAPRVNTPVGIFTYDDTGWMTDPTKLPIIQFLNNELSFRAVESAISILNNLPSLVGEAIEYATKRSNEPDACWDGQGELCFEAIDITSILNDGFALTFGIESKPDFTVTVEFVGGRPQEWWAAD